MVGCIMQESHICVYKHVKAPPHLCIVILDPGLGFASVLNFQYLQYARGFCSTDPDPTSKILDLDPRASRRGISVFCSTASDPGSKAVGFFSQEFGGLDPGP